MIRVKVRVKDKNKVSSLEKYGNIIFKSPILNLVALEINKHNLSKLENDENVLTVEYESEGRLMPV